MESAQLLQKVSSVTSPKIDVTSHGIETARYNSMMHFEVDGKGEFSIFACGNRLIMFDFKSNTILID